MPISPVLPAVVEVLAAGDALEADEFVEVASRFVVASGFAQPAIRSTNSTGDNSAIFDV